MPTDAPQRARDDASFAPTRLIGVGVAGIGRLGAQQAIDTPAQADLFARESASHHPDQREETLDRRVDEVMDAARQRFGVDAIRRGRPV